MLLLLDFISHYVFFLKMLLLLTAAIIIISGLDDVFIDVYFWVRALYRLMFVRSRHKPLEVEALYNIPEQPFAIMIPAWQEADVIAQMLSNTLSTLDYVNYTLFVGVYQNDPATRQEVEKVIRRHKNVQIATVPNDGPTSKADCLNWILQSIVLYEQDNGLTFAGIAMHDAEDVVHRLELKLFNYLIDRKDLMQLPVFSLERKWHEFTAGHYIDEFAECHSKDLVVRESILGAVPSAGVATCFSRRAIRQLAKTNDNLVFNTDTLTEDYDISFRLKELGMTQIFLRYGVVGNVRKISPFTGRPRTIRMRDYVATREYFPNSISTAVRQKSRWLLGIVFQGWRFIGWRGNLATRYFLFRDRKGVITSLGTVSAYFLLANGMGLIALRRWYAFPPLFEVGSMPWWVLMANMGFLVNRMCQRAIFVGMLYGWEQALLSIPRMIVGNVVNFLATFRAIRLFMLHLIFGRRLVWDKTTHAYPSTAELRHMRRRLGDLLIERRVLNVADLHRALAHQKATRRPIGQTLLELGLIDDTTLAGTLAQQLGLPAAELDPREVAPELIAAVPAALARQYKVFPLNRHDNQLDLATAEPLSDAAERALSKQLGYHLVQVIVPRSDIAFALRYGFDAPALEQLFAQAKHLSHTRSLSDTQLETLWRAYRRQHILLGDLLQQQANIQAQDLQPPADQKLGDHLVATGKISAAELDQILAHQQERIGSLLDAASRLGYTTTPTSEGVPL